MSNISSKTNLLVALLVIVLITFTACQQNTNPLVTDNSISSNSIATNYKIKTGNKVDLTLFKSSIKLNNSISNSKSSAIQSDDNDGEDHDGEDNHDGSCGGDDHHNDWENVGFDINIGSILNGINLTKSQTTSIKNYLESYEDCYESAKNSIKKQIETLKKANETKSEAIKKALKKKQITKAEAQAKLDELTATTNSAIADLQSLTVGCDCLDTLFTNIYNNSGLDDNQKAQFKAWAGTLGVPCPLTILVPTGGGVDVAM